MKVNVTIVLSRQGSDKNQFVGIYCKKAIVTLPKMFEQNGLGLLVSISKITTPSEVVGLPPVVFKGTKHHTSVCAIVTFQTPPNIEVGLECAIPSRLDKKGGLWDRKI